MGKLRCKCPKCIPSCCLYNLLCHKNTFLCIDNYMILPGVNSKSSVFKNLMYGLLSVSVPGSFQIDSAFNMEYTDNDS